MSRQDQYAVTVTVADTELGLFDTLTGGEYDSDSLQYRPGGMGPQIALGGFTTVGNVTVSRYYKLDRDNDLVPFLRQQRGKGRMTVTQQPLDTERNPFGAPIVFTGVLKRFKSPDHNSNDSGVAMLELEMTTDDVS